LWFISGVLKADWNLGQLAWLPGLWSLAPLGAVWTIGGWWWARPGAGAFATTKSKTALDLHAFQILVH
jgi:hypothetical protein